MGIKMMRDLPKAEYLHECFSYDEKNGLLRWKTRPREHFSTEGCLKRWNSLFVGKCAGGKDSRGYLQVRLDGRLYLVHRIIWAMCTGNWPDDQLDHKNLDRTDNRLKNLREATRSENNGNRNVLRNSSTGVKGVSPHGKKFRAKITINGKQKYLGTFPTIGEAKSAYDRAATEFFGEFARS